MRSFTLLLLSLVCTRGICQNSIGFPEIINYQKTVYSAGSQNWDIKQDKNGLMYFANNEGLLVFDGTYWKTYPLPNKTIVRSLNIDQGGRIYVGGQGEMGYFSPGNNGDLVYTSLIELIGKNDRSFADVWDIVFYNKSVFFRSEKMIFELSNNHITTYPDDNWRFLGTNNQQLIAENGHNQLVSYNSGNWQPLKNIGKLPNGILVTSFLPSEDGYSYLTTLKNGVYKLKSDTITQFTTPTLSEISSKRIYSASIDNGNLVLATSDEGCFIVNKNGRLIQSFSKKEGLQNNNVLSVYLDKDKNLWLGLDNGIDFVPYNNAIKHIYPDNPEQGTGYAALLFHDRLYMGTSSGLYSISVHPDADLSFVKGKFETVEGSKGQVWNLSVVHDHLLLGHHEGAFLIEGTKAIPLDNSSGYWNFLPYYNPAQPDQMICGTYTGINVFNIQNNQLIKGRSIPFESARFIAIQDNIAWVSHPYKGIYKVDLNNGTNNPVKLYTNKNGLPSINNNYIYRIKNRIVIATDKGLYEYNPAKDSFEPSIYFKDIFGTTSVRYLKEDINGNIWFVHEKSLGVVDMGSQKPQVIYLPEFTNKLVSGFENIYPIDQNNILLGADKGFFHINYNEYKKSNNKIDVYLRSVKTYYKADSVLAGGYITNGVAPTLDYKWNSFTFDFSSPVYNQQSSIEYSYRLIGFDKNWSGWTKKTEKEFTALPPGDYTFEIKAKNNLGIESPISSYSFTLAPPWYKSVIALIAYSLLLIMLSVIVYFYLRMKFHKQQLKHEEESKQLQYLHQLEKDQKEQQINKLRIEKLEAEIQYKNKELASTAMHLIQKGELLSKIKEEFARLQKNDETKKESEGLKKLIKVLNEEDKMDEDWEYFTIHFDQVHSNFLAALKNQYPSLSNNELKLCAYLRMNLSTKEIAQLMKISVRGVEISRYRLRKKLQIPTEVNLFDFLIEFQATANVVNRQS